MITLKEAAQQLGLDPGTLRRQIALGRFSAVKLGRDWFTTKEEVERYSREILGKPGRKP